MQINYSKLIKKCDEQNDLKLQNKLSQENDTSEVEALNISKYGD